MPRALLVELDSTGKKGSGSLRHWIVHAKINRNRLAGVQGRASRVLVPGTLALWRVAAEVTSA